MNKPCAIILSGFLWLFGGMSLLSKGLRFLTEHLPSNLADASPESLAQQKSVLFAISIAFVLGFFKGRWVLRKTAEKTCKRVLSHPGKISFFALYDQRTSFLILGMIFLGFLLNNLSISSFVRGFIDVTVGCALIQGSLLFFRFVFFYRKELFSHL